MLPACENCIIMTQYMSSSRQIKNDDTMRLCCNLYALKIIIPQDFSAGGCGCTCHYCGNSECDLILQQMSSEKEN